ncbi:ATP-binding cassette permease mdl1 [Scheffersomyces spartinae]|uniref:ATP-binding cassette permease mdl1 n=1 Tax=Scheffersomyces spartinae TaxID=45513 RepID=A0A9P7VA24_9ASCO|nr:ATP-binding cassette permease mdl1 [Scheffersomyces spartinae]KAG7193805.1 ATP-binding cassette permease mdl1 [Scheffersomyces spartinae]
MSLPFFIGKIIDTAQPDTTTQDFDKYFNEKYLLEEIDVGDVNKELILGLEPMVFYTALGGFFVVGAVANFGRTYLLRLTSEKIVARLRSKVFGKIMSQDMAFFDVGPHGTGMKTGDLISRISNDTQIISRALLNNISDGLRSIISGGVGLVMMGIVSTKLSMYMAMLFPPIVVMSLVYGRRVKKLSRQIQDNLGAMSKVTEEKINGVKTIQSFAQQMSQIKEYNTEVKNILNTSLREGRLAGLYYAGNGLLGNVTLISLLVVGTQMIQNGELTVGDLSSFMMYAVYTGTSVFGISNVYTEVMKGLGASERIFEVLDLHPHITTSKGKRVDQVYGDIEFNKVQFAYPSRTQNPVLNNFSLKIHKDENICFVGPSGSGKSTISQLLVRFYDPKSGCITLQGEDIKDLNVNRFRKLIGYVQQEPLLFSGTIKENIVFGKKDATEQDVKRAIELSNALFIYELPSGLDTQIGSGHSTQLSGGQKQRISLARTLINRPKTLILDEATSALDSISEEIVMRRLLELNENEGVTLISIAHRLSTIRNSKRVVVLNRYGEIVEDGIFAQLYADPSSELNKLLQHDETE